MNVFHCLFWIKDSMVTSLLYEAGKLNILKFKGRKSVPLDDTFWEEWKTYAGMCHGDQVDLCLIYDEKPASCEPLLSVQCESANCIWSRTKIEEAVKMLEIREPVEIKNESGMLLGKTGCFMHVKEEEIVPMTAWYVKADKDAAETKASLEQSQKTTLIKYYQEELRAYKEEYEK